MNDKELVAHAALDYVEDNMIIGLGTGSTANYFIDGLANKIKSEGLSINVVASSTVSQERAIEADAKIHLVKCTLAPIPRGNQNVLIDPRGSSLKRNANAAVRTEPDGYGSSGGIG